MARPAVLTVADTIAKSFLLAAETRGDRPAIREKKFGIWQPTSWRDWLQISKDIAYALHAIGFRPGDVASIIANAVPEWVFADMGILCAGGVSSGIYPTDSRRAGRISRQRFPHQGDLRRGRRAARQDPVVPGALSDPAKDRRVRHGRPERLLRSDGDVACRIHRARAQPYRRATRRCGRRWSKAAAPTISPFSSTPRARRARPRAPCIPTAACTHQMRHANDLFPSTDSRRAAGVPAALPCRRAGRRLLHLARGRIGDEFRRKPGDRAGQSSRGAADRIPGGAAHLGEVLFGHHHRAEGRNPVPELDVSPRARDRLSHDRLQDRGRSAVAVVAAGQSRRLLAGLPQHPPHAGARPLPDRASRVPRRSRRI